MANFTYVFLEACREWSDKTGVAVQCSWDKAGAWHAVLTIRDTYGAFERRLYPLARERVEYPGRGHQQRRGETPDEYTQRVHKRLWKTIAQMRSERIRANQNRLADLPDLAQAIDGELHKAFQPIESDLPGAAIFLESIEAAVVQMTPPRRARRQVRATEAA